MRVATRWLLVAILSLVALATTGLLASNSMPATKLGQSGTSVTADGIKPSACSAISVTNVVTGNGTFGGTTGNDLILGSGGVDVISGGNGDDCIVGGSGLDTINGGGGTDVCVGHAGVTFLFCETHIP
jgi:Ca2+-binding RTX toxin-like protein